MTVAAIILSASPEGALADADGLPSVRRIADTAWSGGATPVVVVSADPDGSVAGALAGAPVTLAEPAPMERGPAAQMARGIEVALGEVHDTTAALIWPVRLTWVGPETVTSLIEAHGPYGDRLLIPRYDDERGWPILVPLPAGLELLRGAPATAMPDEIVHLLGSGGLEDLELELGDPGTTIDRATARTDLPPYLGPQEPAGGHVHEWGSGLAETEEGPLEGPALAPYAPAAVEGSAPD